MVKRASHLYNFAGFGFVSTPVLVWYYTLYVCAVRIVLRGNRALLDCIGRLDVRCGATTAGREKARCIGFKTAGRSSLR
jgi:hypothetical protein